MNASPAPVPWPYRSEILRYASNLLAPKDRASGQVMAAAAPLLEWAQQAAGRGDLECRMAAMARVHSNELARLAARTPAGDAPKRHLTPAEFLAETGEYYDFVTGAAA